MSGLGWTRSHRQQTTGFLVTVGMGEFVVYLITDNMKMATVGIFALLLAIIIKTDKQ